jgi:WD40 repeat protein
MTMFRAKGRAVPPPTALTLERRWRAMLDGHVISLRFAPDGTRLAAAIADGPIALLSATGERLYELSGHTLGTTALDWHPDGRLLASAGQDGHVRLWDTQTGAQAQALRHSTSWVERVAYHPSGRYLAAAAGKELRVWDDKANLVCAQRDHASTIADIAWKPGTEQIAAVAYGGTTLWALDQPEPLRRYEWKGSSLVLAWSPDAALFATGDQDQTVHFWYADSGKDLQMWGYETKMRELAWDPSSRYLATGGGRDAVVWDTRASKKGPEGSKPVMLGLHEAYLSVLTYQRAEAKDVPALLASAGQDGLVALWRPTRGKKPLAQHGFNTPISQLAWSPDDHALAVGGEDGTVALLTLS